MSTSGAWGLKGLNFVGSEKAWDHFGSQIKEWGGKSVLVTCQKPGSPFCSEDSRLGMPIN